MRNGKPTIELTATDGSNDQILRLEITIEDPAEFDRIRRTVAKVLIDEWSGLGEQLITGKPDEFNFNVVATQSDDTSNNSQ